MLRARAGLTLATRSLLAQLRAGTHTFKCHCARRCHYVCQRALHSPCRCRCAWYAAQDWFLGGCAASASTCIFQFASDRRVVRISAASVYIESQNSVVFLFRSQLCALDYSPFQKILTRFFVCSKNAFQIVVVVYVT